MFSLDNTYIEEQSILNNEVAGKSMDSVVINNDKDFDFLIRSNVYNDDNNDSIRTNEKR